MDAIVANFGPLLATAVVLVVWLALGRAIWLLTHDGTQPVAFPVCVLAGMGAWVVWWLGFVVAAGGDTFIAAMVFTVVVTLGVSGGAHLHWARLRAPENHGVMFIFLSLLLLSPLVGVALARSPDTAADWHFLAALGPWHVHLKDPVSVWAAAGIPALAEPRGWSVVLLAPHVMLGWLSAVPAQVFGFLLVPFMATTLVSIAGVTVRWSNLLLVVACSVLVAMLAAFAVDITGPANVVPALLVPLTLLVALSGFFRVPALAGWEAFPYALTGVFAATLHPWAAAVMAVSAGVWMVLQIVRKQPLVPAMLAGSLMACLPWLMFGVMEGRAVPPTWEALSAVQQADVVHMALMAAVVAFVRAWMGFYAQSALKPLCFAAPWSMGAMVAIPVVAAALGAKALVYQAPRPVIEHARAVGADIRTRALLPMGASVGVMGFPSAVGEALDVTLGGRAHVEQLPEQPTLGHLHRLARTRGYTHVWAGSGSMAGLLGFATPVEASMLMETTPTGLVVRAVYPHVMMR